MIPFLKQVARHYYSLGEIDKCCFVFPNRRAMVFFNKYLGEEAQDSGIPVPAPVCRQMNDFVSALAGERQSSRVKLLRILYDCYKPLYETKEGPGKAEPLDDFIFWGGIILGDFNDVDKYLVDPRQIFANIALYKGMQQDFSFLTETQKSAVEQFLGNFNTDGEYKRRFQTVWDILYDLYCNFNSALDRKELSYEGRIYRKLASALEVQSVSDILAREFPGCEKFVFVGLNALNDCEKKLLKSIRNARMAEFCWDFSSRLIKDRDNRSSFFISENLSLFPQAFEPDPEGLPDPEINVLSVPSSVAQAKQIPQILEAVGKADISTAIVLPDESLLLPVLNSIPEEVRQLNVTMGYPISGSVLWPLVLDLCALQLHVYFKDGIPFFYHRQVWSILSNSLLRLSLSPEGLKTADDIRAKAQCYVPVEQFNSDPVLESVFKVVVTDPSSCEPDRTEAFARYLQDVLKTLAVGMNDTMELDFAKKIYQTLEELMQDPLPVKPATFVRVLQQMCAGDTVPFQGEPMQGLQIMGPLETRALDFENIIVLSCNEGTFPRRSTASSFIPGELRKGFGMPTYEYKDAMWAYYFYRMVQRASKVWLLYDSRTEGVKVGEESRFIKQLELHFELPVCRWTAKSEIKRLSVQGDIPKTAEDIRKLREGHLSASAIKDYLSCPAKFYYAYVVGLRKDTEVAENLDASMFGQVFHEAMEILYDTPDRKVSAACLESLLKSPSHIKDLVSRLILDKQNAFEISGKNIIYRDMICSYVRQVIKRDIEFLKDGPDSCFTILGLERRMEATIGGYRFVGVIDRLDSVTPGQIRVIDYKTGRVTDQDINITDENAAEVVENLFGSDDSKRPPIAVQLYIYDLFVKEDRSLEGNMVFNSIYQPANLFVEGVRNVAMSPEFCALMKPRLQDLLDGLSDLSVPWKRCDDASSCSFCNFKQICGR